MPNSFYQITISNFNGTTPCESYLVYTGTTYNIDSADYVEDVTVPVSGYTLSLDIDSSYTGVYLFIEHCDGHISSVPSSTPKLQGGYQLVFVDLRCSDCIDSGPTPTITPTLTVTPTYSQTITLTLTPTYSQTITPTYSQTITPTIISELPCDCYIVECTNPEGCRLLTYTDCDGFTDPDGLIMFSGATVSLCGSISDLEQFGLIITPNDSPCSFDGEIYSCSPPTEPTPTYSQTVTPTYSQTVTPTYSQTVTPTYSQTVTPTVTITETPIIEPTPTPTSTPISETPCDCYIVECTNPEGCILLTYIDCNGNIEPDGVSILPSTTVSLCGSITTLDQNGMIITPTGNPCLFDGETYLCSSGTTECQCATIIVDARDLGASDDNTLYVNMTLCDGSELLVTYSTADTYMVCVQSINSPYILVGGFQNIPLYSIVSIIPGSSCTVDNDCMT